MPAALVSARSVAIAAAPQCRTRRQRLSSTDGGPCKAGMRRAGRQTEGRRANQQCQFAPSTRASEWQASAAEHSLGQAAMSASLGARHRLAGEQLARAWLLTDRNPGTAPRRSLSAVGVTAGGHCRVLASYGERSRARRQHPTPHGARRAAMVHTTTVPGRRSTRHAAVPRPGVRAAARRPARIVVHSAHDRPSPTGNLVTFSPTRRRSEPESRSRRKLRLPATRRHRRPRRHPAQGVDKDDALRRSREAGADAEGEPPTADALPSAGPCRGAGVLGHALRAIQPASRRTTRSGSSSLSTAYTPSWTGGSAIIGGPGTAAQARPALPPCWSTGQARAQSGRRRVRREPWDSFFVRMGSVWEAGYTRDGTRRTEGGGGGARRAAPRRARATTGQRPRPRRSLRPSSRRSGPRGPARGRPNGPP